VGSTRRGPARELARGFVASGIAKRKSRWSGTVRVLLIL
jgi:hypothetical protein